MDSCKNQDNDHLKASNDQKGLIHYNREYVQSGEDSYRKVVTIWTSKVLLMERIIRENPYGTDRFAWVDVSFSRFGKDCIDAYKKNKISTIRNNMKYYGETIQNNASFMSSDTETWMTFIELYMEQLNAVLDSNYAHDEETIMHLVCRDNPDLFHVIQ